MRCFTAMLYIRRASANNMTRNTSAHDKSGSGIGRHTVRARRTFGVRVHVALRGFDKQLGGVIVRNLCTTQQRMFT